jgi:hypothetical protein
LLAARRRRNGAGGFFLRSIRCNFPAIAVIEKLADHIRWDLACALLVKLMGRHELKAAVSSN